MQQDHQDGDILHEEAEDEEAQEQEGEGEEESGDIGRQEDDEEDSVLLHRPGLGQRVRRAHRGLPAGEWTKKFKIWKQFKEMSSTGRFISSAMRPGLGRL